MSRYRVIPYAILILAIVYVSSRNHSKSDGDGEPTSRNEVVKHALRDPFGGAPDDPELARPEPGDDAAPAGANLPPSPLDQLNRPGTTPEDDLRLLAILFADYASVFQRVPLGTHEEIVAALRGDNPRSIKYIPDGHPAVNAAKQITDRWQTPFFFHVIARNAVEIISAGPDRQLFTADDIRHTPPHASVEPLTAAP